MAAGSRVQAWEASSFKTFKLAAAALSVPMQSAAVMACSMALAQAVQSSAVAVRSARAEHADVTEFQSLLRLVPQSPEQAEEYWRRRSAAPEAQLAEALEAA